MRGGKRLNGEITVKAAKNSVLPLIAASLLSKEDIVLKNIPRLSDITHMLDIVRCIGGKAEYEGGDVHINCRLAADAPPGIAASAESLDGAPAKSAACQNAYAPSVFIQPCQTSALRSSIFMLGPALARFKSACVGLPGGCAIGERPIDIHIAGLKKLNVQVYEENGCVRCDGSHMTDGAVRLRFPSVGATENLIMASALGKGRTVIYNAAREPEVVDLASFINFLGGRVLGAGTNKVVIEGVERLGGGAYRPFSDRIAAPTYLAAVAAAGGTITVKNVAPENFSAVLGVFRQAGCRVAEGKDYVTLASDGRLKAVSTIVTAPFPGFPTDMQAQTAAMLSVADGESALVENVFENRFRYAVQLAKMGARITVSPGGRAAVIRGVGRLRGARVAAEDLRGGAALVIAALAAEGTSEVFDIFHIDRGYERMDEVLAGLNADIQRKTDVK